MHSQFQDDVDFSALCQFTAGFASSPPCLFSVFILLMCSGWRLHPFFCTSRWTLRWRLNLCLSWSVWSLLWFVCHYLCFSDLFGDVTPSLLEFLSFLIQGILTHACYWVMKTRLFRLINMFRCKIPTFWVEVCFASFQWSTSNLQNTTWCSEKALMTAWSSVFASDMWKIPMSESNFSFFFRQALLWFTTDREQWHVTCFWTS